jgi:hypothetical protein
MKKDQLKKANEITKQIARLEIEHEDFRKNMGYGVHIPEVIKISSGELVWAQTEIKDGILIAVILKEVDNRFREQIEVLKQEFKNL